MTTRVQAHLEARAVDPGWTSEPGREWLAAAACAGMPVDLFYPGRGEADGPAKQVCRSCPVAAQCLLEALSVPTFADHGVWGGTSPTQRARMRPRRAVCRNGHAATDANTRRATSGLACRECRHESDRRRRGGFDEALVQQIIDGKHTVPPYTKSSDRVEAVRRLAAAGYTDPQIGQRIGATTHAVFKIRYRHGIVTAGMA